MSRLLTWFGWLQARNHAFARLKHERDALALQLRALMDLASNGQVTRSRLLAEAETSLA